MPFTKFPRCFQRPPGTKPNYSNPTDCIPGCTHIPRTTLCPLHLLSRHCPGYVDCPLLTFPESLVLPPALQPLPPPALLPVTLLPSLCPNSFRSHSHLAQSHSPELARSPLSATGPDPPWAGTHHARHPHILRAWCRPVPTSPTPGLQTVRRLPTSPRAQHRETVSNLLGTEFCVSPKSTC